LEKTEVRTSKFAVAVRRTYRRREAEMELETQRGAANGAASVLPRTARVLAALRPPDDRPSPGSRTLFPEIEKLLARAASH
jgi:hypothetical protein